MFIRVIKNKYINNYLYNYLMFQKAYTFDDVALVPQYNNIQSRTEPSLETWLTKNIKTNFPLKIGRAHV